MIPCFFQWFFQCVTFSFLDWLQVTQPKLMVQINMFFLYRFFLGQSWNDVSCGVCLAKILNSWGKSIKFGWTIDFFALDLFELMLNGFCYMGWKSPLSSTAYHHCFFPNIKPYRFPVTNTFWGSAFRGSKDLLKRYLEEFGRLGKQMKSKLWLAPIYHTKWEVHVI